MNENGQLDLIRQVSLSVYKVIKSVHKKLCVFKNNKLSSIIVNQVHFFHFASITCILQFSKSSSFYRWHVSAAVVKKYDDLEFRFP